MLQFEAIAHNVSGSLRSTGYTSFPGVEFWFSYDLVPLNQMTGGLTCSTGPSASNISITMINECASPGTCCINTGRYLVCERLLARITDIAQQRQGRRPTNHAGSHFQECVQSAYVTLWSATQMLQCIRLRCNWCFDIHMLNLLVAAGVVYMCEVARSTASTMYLSKHSACTKLAVMCRVLLAMHLCQKSWPEFARVLGSMTQSARASATTAHLSVRSSRGSYQTPLLTWKRHAACQVTSRGY